MSRHIDVDALKEFIGKVRAEYDFFTDEERPRYEAHSKALELLNIYLDDAPTIDAVEVVRCKDCKWRKACKVFSQQQITDDSYCSWGEREGE